VKLTRNLKASTDAARRQAEGMLSAFSTQYSIEETAA
jgi:hypothetical protein